MSLIRLSLWLKFFYRQEAGGGYGVENLSWKGPVGPCSVAWSLPYWSCSWLGTGSWVTHLYWLLPCVTFALSHDLHSSSMRSTWAPVHPQDWGGVLSPALDCKPLESKGKGSMFLKGASLVAQMVRVCLQCGRPDFSPWVRKILWRREWLPTPVFLPREFHGQRRLAGYSPWGHKGLDTTE